MIPDDHELSFLAARSTAFREADCCFVDRHAAELRHRSLRAAALLGPTRKLIQVDIDPARSATPARRRRHRRRRAGRSSQQLLDAGEGKLDPKRYSRLARSTWREIEQARQRSKKQR